MRQDWVKIFSATEIYQVKVAEDLLKQNGIESHIVTTPDSAFPSIGEAGLYTPPKNYEAAMALLKEHDIK